MLHRWKVRSGRTGAMPRQRITRHSGYAWLVWRGGFDTLCPRRDVYRPFCRDGTVFSCRVVGLRLLPSRNKRPVVGLGYLVLTPSASEPNEIVEGWTPDPMDPDLLVEGFHGGLDYRHVQLTEVLETASDKKG